MPKMSLGSSGSEHLSLVRVPEGLKHQLLGRLQQLKREVPVKTLGGLVEKEVLALVLVRLLCRR